jgi:hypothetical protein
MLPNCPMFAVKTMNHYVSLSLTNRKSSVHLHDLYSPSTALSTFTPRRDQLVICVQFKISFEYNIIRTEHIPDI